MATLAANRTAKAIRLADAIRTLPDWRPAMVAVLPKMSPRWWADVADLAGTKPPSVDTIATVTGLLDHEAAA